MIFVLELSAKNVNIYLRLSLLKVFNTKIRSTLSCTGLYWCKTWIHVNIYVVFFNKNNLSKNIKLRQP